MVDIPVALLRCHPLMPKQANSFDQLLFAQGFHCSSNEMLKLLPYPLNWVEVRTAGRYWPPVDPFALTEVLCHMTSML